jgi:hypothetical protein
VLSTSSSLWSSGSMLSAVKFAISDDHCWRGLKVSVYLKHGEAMWNRLGQFCQSLAFPQTQIALDRTQSSRASKTLASKRQKPHLASLLSHLTASPFPKKMAAPCRLRSSRQLGIPGRVQSRPMCARDC